MYHYYAYGFRVSSSILLPELLAEDREEPCDYDVLIHEGTFDAGLPEPRAGELVYRLKPEFTLHIRDVARFRLKHGKEVIVQRDEASDDATVRLYLLSWVFAALLIQRGLLPLHASCIDTSQGAVLFIGSSGVGKSTLAVAFHEEHGYALLADDVSAVYMDGDQPFVNSSFPQVKLWPKSLSLLQKDTHNLLRIRPQVEKYAVPVHNAFVSSSRPIHALYLLVPTEAPNVSIEPVLGINKVFALRQHTYRGQFLEEFGKITSHFQMASLIALHVRMAKIQRPQKKDFKLSDLVAMIENDFA